MDPADLVVQRADLPHYAPPGHSGTVNVRLTDSSFCTGFEMILGTLEPGAVAERHHHEHEYQAMYVLSGEARVTLGSNAPQTCSSGTAIRIPPGLDHHVSNAGSKPLELLIVYSPPLPPREDS